MTRKRYVSWDELNALTATIARKITLSGWVPDRIVGIGRGGLTTAVMLSHYFKVPMTSLDVALRDGDEVGPESNCWLPEDAAAGKKILIVDDINDTGATINWIKQDWDSSVRECLTWGDGIRIATLFDKLSSKSELKVSYTAEEIGEANEKVWIVFPYENWWAH
jgi:hypoxanthine phosphoribosyltransferase